MTVEDRAYAAQRMTADGGDFGFGATGKGEPRHRRAAQVIERHADDASRLASLGPRRPEAIRCPRFAVAVGEDDRAAFWRGIERGFERRANADDYARPSLPLPRADVCSVITRPRKPQQVALPL